MRSAVKSDKFEYYWYVLCYVNDILSISHDPMRTMVGIKETFKLKDDKKVEPDIYLGVEQSKLDNADGDIYWTASSAKYCAAAVQNIEDILKNQQQRLPSKCATPIQNGYRPEVDVSPELKADGLQWYQEMIGMLSWAVELGRVDILYEVAIMSTFIAMPRMGHLEQVMHIFGYLKAHNTGNSDLCLTVAIPK